MAIPTTGQGLSANSSTTNSTIATTDAFVVIVGYGSSPVDYNLPFSEADKRWPNLQASRTANTFLAAPNGSSGAATFRGLASADIPALASLVLDGSTSGTVTVVAPTVAGANTFTIPAVTDTAAVLGTAQTFTAPQTVSPSLVTSGTQTAMTITGAANTGLTASTEDIDVNVNLARTVQFATGAIATQRAMVIQAPTYAFVGTSTITTAATLAISGPPVAGTHATISNSYSLYVASGTTFLGGNITLSSSDMAITGGGANTLTIQSGGLILNSNNTTVSLARNGTKYLTLQSAPLNSLVYTLTGFGVTSTDGFIIQNTTAATSGAQAQWSPRLHFIGQGWKTTATAASQTVEFIAELQTVAGTSSPTGNLVISSQINAAGYTAVAAVTAGGDLQLNAAGHGLQVKSGSNCKLGTATLASGTVTVSNTAVTTNSRIFLTAQSVSGTPGGLSIGTVVAGTSFVINSTSGSDASVVAFHIIEAL